MMYSVTRKPVVVLLTWLGSSPQLTCKYSKMYQDLGLEVILKCPSLMSFIWPRSGIKDALQFLIKLKKEIGPHGCPIIVHGISIGCYYYSLIMHHFKTNQKMFSVIEKNIRCQFMDSPVVSDPAGYATSIANIVASSNIGSLCIWASISSYFYLTSPFTCRYYEYFVHLFLFEQPVVPTLMMSCVGDPMTTREKFDYAYQCFMQRGCETTKKYWEDSVHAQHLKYHPVTYKELVYNLIIESIPEMGKPSSLL
uniref:Uncharacterized protein LOC100186401 n=1 Tax=Phallusia mammillata TaxID=59560 RepID=A0A6F9DJ73_9ASCI|nr:uncharacterized protein LOC100186401 [Phallusia mammillata]